MSFFRSQQLSLLSTDVANCSLFDVAELLSSPSSRPPRSLRISTCPVLRIGVPLLAPPAHPYTAEKRHPDQGCSGSQAALQQQDPRHIVFCVSSVVVSALGRAWSSCPGELCGVLVGAAARLWCPSVCGLPRCRSIRSPAISVGEWRRLGSVQPPRARARARRPLSFLSSFIIAVFPVLFSARLQQVRER